MFLTEDERNTLITTLDRTSNIEFAKLLHCFSILSRWVDNEFFGHFAFSTEWGDRWSPMARDHYDSALALQVVRVINRLGGDYFTVMAGLKEKVSEIVTRLKGMSTDDAEEGYRLAKDTIDSLFSLSEEITREWLDKNRERLSGGRGTNSQRIANSQ